jgi:hypothetical protein
MTLETDALIRRLAETIVPVRRLPAPRIRTMFWLVIAVP